MMVGRLGSWMQAFLGLGSSCWASRGTHRVRHSYTMDPSRNSSLEKHPNSDGKDKDPKLTAEPIPNAQDLLGQCSSLLPHNPAWSPFFDKHVASKQHLLSAHAVLLICALALLQLLFLFSPKPKTLNPPKPQTLNPKTLNPKNPKP